MFNKKICCDRSQTLQKGKKVNAVPVHALEAYRRSRVATLSLGKKWMRRFNFMPWSLYPPDGTLVLIQ